MQLRCAKTNGNPNPPTARKKRSVGKFCPLTASIQWSLCQITLTSCCSGISISYNSFSMSCLSSFSSRKKGIPEVVVVLLVFYVVLVVSWPPTVWGPAIVMVHIAHLSVCLSISATKQDRCMVTTKLE